MPSFEAYITKLCAQIAHTLRMPFDSGDFRQKSGEQGTSYRFVRFLEHIGTTTKYKRVLIVLDEMESIIPLTFNRDIIA
jgi:hypothetical protein